MRSKRERRYVRGSLVALLTLTVAAAMIACGGDAPKSDTGSTTPEAAKTTEAATPKPTPKVISESALLKELRLTWGKDITRVEVSGTPDDVRLDVYTTYYPDSDVWQRAQGIAGIAAMTDLVLDKYPTTTITAYVWPKGDDPDWYMTRAIASYTDGQLDEPISKWVNPALEQ